MRKDCVRVKKVDSVHGIMPFLMKKRTIKKTLVMP